MPVSSSGMTIPLDQDQAVHMAPTLEPRWVEMFQWAPPLTQETSLWDLHHILVWEGRALAWGQVDQVLDIQVWEDPVQAILGWEGRVLATLEWVDQVPFPCPQKRYIHLTSPWFSTHRTPMLHQSILAGSATKKFMTMTRQSFVNLAATSGFTACALVW